MEPANYTRSHPLDTFEQITIHEDTLRKLFFVKLSVSSWIV